MSTVVCVHCNGWGCTHCGKAELAQVAKAGGEQGPDAHDLEVARLTRERDEAMGELDKHRRLLLPNMERKLDEARAEIERLSKPIDGLSPGPVYVLADVDRIEAVRGKPYERLRATVAALEAVQHVDLSAATLGPASPAELMHRAECEATDPNPTPPERPRAKAIEEALTSLGAQAQSLTLVPCPKCGTETAVGLSLSGEPTPYVACLSPSCDFVTKREGT